MASFHETTGLKKIGEALSHEKNTAKYPELICDAGIHKVLSEKFDKR